MVGGEEEGKVECSPRRDIAVSFILSLSLVVPLPPRRSGPPDELRKLPGLLILIQPFPRWNDADDDRLEISQNKVSCPVQGGDASTTVPANVTPASTDNGEVLR